MDPGLAPSLEGIISRAVALACLISSGSHFLYEMFGSGSATPMEKRPIVLRILFWLDSKLANVLRWLGRSWGTIGLLLLAFAIATVVPTYEVMLLKQQMVSQICTDPDFRQLPACHAFVPKLTASDFFRTVTLMKGTAIDTFQFGLWLLTLFFVGVAADVLAGKAHAKGPRERLFVVSLAFSGLLWFVGWAQDLLGR